MSFGIISIIHVALIQFFLNFRNNPLVTYSHNFTVVNCNVSDTVIEIVTWCKNVVFNRRSSLRRKLKSRAQLSVQRIPTGAAFAADAQVDAYYALFDAVYAQSEIHFDKLTRGFFADLLRDADNGGIVFEYRDAQSDALLGWNLCFEHDGRLIDKYIGLSYPAAREANLYFVSWMVNLEYALERGLSHYVAGWTDPEVKAQLGASFTMTQHLVFIRNPLLRALGRRFSGVFENDRQWSDKA